MITSTYSVDQEIYKRTKPQFLTAKAESLNPYGRSEYRIVKCNKVYRKNQAPVYSFTVLACDNQIRCIKVFESPTTIEVFKQVQHCLNTGKPAVVRFSELILMTYMLPRSMGLSVYSSSCEFVDKLPELPYYTASITEEKNID